ncbi:MAG: ATP-binding protein [Bryobacteraceae bacterium]
MALKRVLLSWSSGKDSVWALRSLRRDRQIEIAALLTTFNGAFDRVAMHAVRRVLAREQAACVGLPLWEVDLPWPCSNEQYESCMRAVIERARAENIHATAFGDLFLEDIRAYRERQLAGTGIEPIFPLWRIPTRELAREMVQAGLKAKLTCIDPKKLDRSFAGADYDAAFLQRLSADIDPCGENGEFHTFVYDSPEFSRSIPVINGGVVERDGFVFADCIRAGMDCVPTDCASRTSRFDNRRDT